MPAKKRSWREKVDALRATKKVVLDAPFAGIPAGSRLFVATPQVVEAYVRAIPRGEARTAVRLRRELARRHGCDATCPVSTAIFLRMVAEAAWEEVQRGTPATQVAPFWRVVEPDSALARKLSVDADWLRARREEEGLSSVRSRRTSAAGSGSRALARRPARTAR